MANVENYRLHYLPDNYWADIAQMLLYQSMYCSTGSRNVDSIATLRIVRKENRRDMLR